MKSHQRQSAKPDAWKEAETYGCDVALLEESLRMTPAQRIEAHRSALALAQRLRAAMEKANAKSRKPSKAGHRPSC
jgi:hypothetical protein